jgi:hypothetical protein
MIMNGRVVGTWKRTLIKKRIQMTMEPFSSLNKAAKQAFSLAAERYGKFVGMPIDL